MNNSILLFNKTKVDKIDPPTPPGPGNKTDGIAYTVEDIEKWSSRYNQQMYWTWGKHYTNNPCDMGTVVSRASTALTKDFVAIAPQVATPGHGTWNRGSTYVTNAGYATPSWARDVSKEANAAYGTDHAVNYILYAAFIGRITGNTAMSQHAASILLKDVRNGQLDWTDENEWKADISTPYPLPNGTARENTLQSNPFFYLGEFCYRHCQVYDYCKSELTEAERSEVLTWISNFGYFLIDNMHGMLRRAYDDYPTCNKPKSAYNVWNSKYTHDGGHKYNRLSGWYHNRLSSQLVGVFAAALYTGDSALLDQGIHYWKLFMKHHFYYDGTSAETQRGANQSKFINYFGVLAHHMVECAHLLWKINGDDQLFTYSTSEGLTAVDGSGANTTGGPKTLEVIVEAYLKYLKTVAGGGWDRSLGQPIDGYYRDSTNPTSSSIGKKEQNRASSILMYDYYRNEKWLNNVRWGTAQGFRWGLVPRGNVTGVGAFIYPQGIQGISIDINFMHAPDPDVIWP